MLLRNWYKAVYAAQAQKSGTSPEATLVLYDGTTKTFSMDNSTYSMSVISMAGYSLVTSTQYNGGTYIVVGSGSTPPTMDDYWLENQITTIQGTVNVTKLESGGASMLITITNTGTSDITISEIGLSAYCKQYFLKERTLLDAPITLAPEGVGQITYTVNFPLSV